MIRITPAIAIDEREISESFIRASGPGGQNVNKLATAVELRFDAARSRAIDPITYSRLKRLAGRRLTQDGILAIKSQTYRTQERNRAEALARFVDLIRRAATLPRARFATTLPAHAKKKRRRMKTHRSTLKKLRTEKPDVD